MSMQTDVFASQALTTDGQMLDQAGNEIGRCRVKALLIVPSATAGTVELRDGGETGDVKMTINTVASATQPTYMLLPGEGVLFSTDVYAVPDNVTSAMVFYG